MKAVKPSEAAADSTLARQLWDVSEKLTGAKMQF
jgi:hypothetical protein